MKVATILENNIDVGGGYTMALSSLIQIDGYLKKNNIENNIYVYTKNN